MNKVELLGTLTVDAKVEQTQSGWPIWQTTLAVNGARYDGQSKEHVVTTLYVSLRAYGWMADRLGGWRLQKGEEVHVTGELDQREVKKKDGTVERKTRVTALFVVPTRRKMARPDQAPPPEEPGQDPVEF